jgi:sigma54-dependent transcription regulator
MLSHEWRELEVLCEKISDLRHRYAAALKTRNAGLVEGLKADLARTKRLRELVVHHISARISWAAAEQAHSPYTLDAAVKEQRAAARSEEPPAASERAPGSKVGLGL